MGSSIILVGCGNMGYAMLRGWLDAGKAKPDEMIVVEPADALRARAGELGVRAVSTVEELEQPAQPRLVLFAVKPQVMGDVVPAYRRFVGPATTFVSVAAGTAIAAFEAMLGAQASIMRCMPNTPAAIGQGMMVLVSNANVTADAAAFIEDLVSANGRVATLEREELMDAVTAVSGSGPAYVFHFIESLTQAAIDAGLPTETARLLAMQTVHGAARLAAQSDEDPGELRRQVTSPNGTTAAALEVLMGNDRLKILVGEAVDAARRRSIELGK